MTNPNPTSLEVPSPLEHGHVIWYTVTFGPEIVVIPSAQPSSLVSSGWLVVLHVSSHRIYLFYILYLPLGFWTSAPED